MMKTGTPVLTPKGRDAIKHPPENLSARCRNILIQVNGMHSLDDIRTLLRGLDGVEEAIEKLLADGFIMIGKALNCKDAVKSAADKLLGTKAPTILRKIDEMHAKYGEACWQHLDELDKAARLFYGEVVAENLKNEIERVLKETQK